MYILVVFKERKKFETAPKNLLELMWNHPLLQVIFTLLHFTKPPALCYITPSHLHFVILHQVTFTLLHSTQSPALCYITPIKSPSLCYMTPNHRTLVTFHQVTYTLLHYTKSPALCFITPSHLDFVTLHQMEGVGTHLVTLHQM